MWCIALGKELYKAKIFKGAIITTAVLSAIGVLASLAHLGRPFAALNSLSNLGSSWLSREVFLAGIFTGIALLYAIIQHFKSENNNLGNILIWTGSVVGFITAFAMAKVYTATSVAAWHGLNTFVDFYATTIVVGALIFLVTSLNELQNVDKKIFGFIILTAAIIQVVVAVPYAIGLGQNGMAAQASAELLNSMSGIIGLKWLFILGGASILMWLTTRKVAGTGEMFNGSMIYLAGAALIVGEIIGRYVFYAVMVASKVGLTRPVIYEELDSLWLLTPFDKIQLSDIRQELGFSVFCQYSLCWTVKDVELWLS